MSPATATSRKMMMPAGGFTSAVEQHMATPDKAVGEGGATLWSKNMLYDRAERAWYRRNGSAAGAGTDGILEAGATNQRCRQLLAFKSPSVEDLGDGYETFLGLFTNETLHTAQLYLRSPIGPIDYVLGAEFSSSHYPGTTAATANIKCIPYYRTTDGAYGRLNSAAARRLFAAGSRNVVEIERQALIPSLNAFPVAWNGRYNENTSSGSQNLHLKPIGHLRPPPSLTVSLPSAGTAGTASWLSFDLFYLSQQFVYADGSVSPWSEPRPVGPDLTAGLMRFELGGAANTPYDYITVSGISIGPSGPIPCIARRILRSTKRAGLSTGAATTAPPSPLDLKLAAYIPNNTQTSIRLYDGNDLSLVDDPLQIRFDDSLCPPSRCMWTADNRVFVGYTKRHPAAIILWPDVNVADDSATIVTDSYEADFGASNANKITLKKNNSAGTQITCDSTVTLQEVVDRINATVSGGSGGKWWAQVAPGADAFATGDKLCGTASAGTPAGPANVDVGDTSQRLRSFAHSYGLILCFSTTYLADFPTQKQRIFFTQGGPGMPTLASHSWSSSPTNYRNIPSHWGILLGGAPLTDGCIVFCTNTIGILRNVKSGKSGLDEDYELIELFANEGCIAYDSIFFGNGVAGCLTRNGILITDGAGTDRKRYLSADVWKLAESSGVGEWAYEIGQCVAAARGDTDGAHFHCRMLSGQLHVTYRSDASVTIPNRMLVYDFSSSAHLAGLPGMLDEDGRPLPWSTPLTLSGSVLVEVTKSTGVARFMAIEANAGTTNGRIDQFDTGTTDTGAVAIASALWSCRDFMDETKRQKIYSRFTPVYRKNGAGLTFKFFRDGLTSTPGTTDDTGGGIALPTTGTAKLANVPYPLPHAARGRTRIAQFAFIDDGTVSPATPLKIWGVDFDPVEVLESVN